jgi:hypothetical protein
MDRGHAPAAELALEHVAVMESFGEVLGDRRGVAALREGTANVSG